MKILQIIRSVNPEGGGPIEGVRQLSHIMQTQGHSIEIVSLDSPDESYVKQCPITVHATGPGIGIYGYSKKFKPWLEVHAKHYDAFIINGIWQYHGFATHSVLKSKNIPYYIFTHGMLDPWFKRQYPLKHLKKWLYWPWGEYPVLRDAKKVLFTCEDEKILARESFWLYRCTEQVVNFGTAGHTGNVEEQRRLFFSSFPHLQGKRFLLFLSRIHPKKGIDLLIEAFAITGKEWPELELVIAGPDQIGIEAELRQLADKLGIAEKITWTGMISGDIKWGAYHAADAFILTSHSENFGIVVAEALSCYLPVLISNKVNIWQEIVQDNAGLVANDTIDGSIDLLNRWRLLDVNNKAKMRENARTCFVDRFEIGKAAKSLLEVLER